VADRVRARRRLPPKPSPPAHPPTRPTGPPGGVPTGQPTPVSPRQDEDVRRSLGRENDTAVILARHKYRVHQNPTRQEVAGARSSTGDVGKPGKEPDFLLEGRVFDCYAPGQGKPVRSVWSEVATKVRWGQTQRVVLNLQDWGDDVDSVRRQFADWPINGLKEVKAVTIEGRVVDIWHG